MTDRGVWFVRPSPRLNVRRLMYQSLIWPFVAGNDSRGLRASFNAEDLERLTDALVDRVRRNVELGRDFLRIEVLVDEEEAVELTLAEPRHALGHPVRSI